MLKIALNFKCIKIASTKSIRLCCLIDCELVISIVLDCKNYDLII